MSDFRADAAATSEWIARYFEDVRELPVLAQVEPGAVRKALPASPPERGEPGSAARTSPGFVGGTTGRSPTPSR